MKNVQNQDSAAAENFEKVLHHMFQG